MDLKPQLYVLVLVFPGKAFPSIACVCYLPGTHHAHSSLELSTRFFPHFLHVSISLLLSVMKNILPQPPSQSRRMALQLLVHHSLNRDCSHHSPTLGRSLIGMWGRLNIFTCSERSASASHVASPTYQPLAKELVAGARIELAEFWL